MRYLERLKDFARRIKRDVMTVYFAARDPAAPFVVRVLALLIVAYALSPIDLIPDFVPVLGYLDDLIIVPAGLWLVLRLLPPDVVADARARLHESTKRPRSRLGAMLVICVWVGLTALVAYCLLR